MRLKIVGRIRFALVTGLFVGCGPAPSVELIVSSAASIDTFAVSGLLDDGTALGAQSSAYPPERGAVLLLLPDRFVGHTLSLDVFGFDGATSVAHGRTEATIDTERVTTTVVLVALDDDPPPQQSPQPLPVPAPETCADGVLQAPESCDDGNAVAGDGCADNCTEEPDWLCLGTPSLCRSITEAVLVDTRGPSCPFATGSGTRADPFCSIAAAIADRSDALIILGAGLYEGPIDIDGDDDIRLLGDDGVVIAADRSPALKVKGGARVHIENVTITGANGSGGGIKVETEGSALFVSRSTIGPSSAIGVDVKAGDLTVSASRIVDNAKGGAKLNGNGRHNFINTVVARNGGPEEDVGGLAFLATSTASRVVHATVADNRALDDQTAGVSCESAVDVVNTIVWNNEGGATAGVDTDCTVHFSITAEDGFPGDGNVFADPRFLDEDYHVDTNSGAIDAGDRERSLAADIDGDLRPLGAGVDIGADEAR